MVNFRVIILAFSLILNYGTQAQRDLRVIFEVYADSTWEWMGHGTITIATDDTRENKRFGRHTAHVGIGRGSVQEIKTRLPYEKFNGRSVSIDYTGWPDDCLFLPRMSGLILTDKSKTTIVIQRNEDCWNNRTIGFYGSFALIRKLYTTGTDTAGVIPVQVKFPGRILEIDRSDSVFISFSVDSTCKVIDRQVIQQFTHLRDDVPDEVFDNIERALRKNFNRCAASSNNVVPIRYIAP